jgi:Sulfotransferase domain
VSISDDPEDSARRDLEGEAPLVNFLIVGTQRGGTTSLASYLAAHTEICIADCKEVHFFDSAEEYRGWSSSEARAAYHAAFPNYTGERLVGEASPTYMYLPCVSPRIREYNPNMKLIFLLRDPGKRAISQYWHERETGRERLPMRLAFLLETWRLHRDRDDWSDRSSLRRHSYVDRGHYDEQIQRMLVDFPREQMLFLQSEQLFDDHVGSLEAVYEFLGVERPETLPDAARQNSASGSRSERTYGVERATRACLESTRALETTLSWDLTEWKRE